MVQNFIECIQLVEANRVDLEMYRFVGFDQYRGYIFARRLKKGEKR